MKLSELKGKLKVGMKVKEVRKESESACGELQNGREAIITDLSEHYIWFNRCYHSWDDNIQLEFTHSWDNLYPGMILEHGNSKSMVLEVGASSKTFLRSYWDKFDRAGSWYTIKEAQEYGWKIAGETTTEYTLGELEDKLNMEKGSLRVKK